MAVHLVLEDETGQRHEIEVEEGCTKEDVEWAVREFYAGMPLDDESGYRNAWLLRVVTAEYGHDGKIQEVQEVEVGTTWQKGDD